jgi:hypothetical protein
MARRLLWWQAGLMCVGLGAGVGCQVFDADLLPPTKEDAGLPGEDDGCYMGSKRPPERPSADTEGPSITEEIWFALKDVVLSNVNASLNVDRMCTSNGGPWTCLPAPELERYLADESFITPPDGPQGEENQFAREIYPIVNGFFEGEQGALEITAQTAEGQGIGNPLIRIKDYNGEANDPRVTVIISQSVFSLAGQAGATTPPPVCIQEYAERGGVPHFPHQDDVVDADPALTQCFGEEMPKLEVEREYDTDGLPVAITSYDPAWDEGRIWAWARHDTFRDRSPDQPVVVDDVAYVRDWTLVARLPDNVELKLVGEGQAVVAKFTDAFAVANMKPDLSGTEANQVLVAGRWSVNALLETAASVGVCPGTTVYVVANSQLTQRTDVRSNRDQEGLDVPCDAFSFGITLTAHRANFADVTLGQPVPNACE